MCGKKSDEGCVGDKKECPGCWGRECSIDDSTDAFYDRGLYQEKGIKGTFSREYIP